MKIRLNSASVEVGVEAELGKNKTRVESDQPENCCTKPSIYPQGKNKSLFLKDLLLCAWGGRIIDNIPFGANPV